MLRNMSTGLSHTKRLSTGLNWIKLETLNSVIENITNSNNKKQGHQELNTFDTQQRYRHLIVAALGEPQLAASRTVLGQVQCAVRAGCNSMGSFTLFLRTSST